jgi:phosphoribosylamine--glycine ligase
VIRNLELVEESVVFHAGTRLAGEEILTNGGRVLAVSSIGNSMEEALSKSYRNIERISFEKMYFRSDLGFDLK